ncbi:OsmC family protein [Spirosoma utsteinense]|uniref:Osmotically inducible protein OsmC n=1 Tax=Spirosoma utsteinense TaxID=2585773 RepID=A0ABR6W619_9BACT|nr:OsmC family protein [Spirosoma utsteinense]MBC3785859.1 osmotically inducible protein OsmC [Spirosoma utsteinense]MBC3792031.1 osmotically inducible protein OsmC [Spirosoma utsteinense]
MAGIKRTSEAVWNGTGMEGSGTLSSTSGVLNQTPYSFKARFQNEDGKAGTNPEELIAAAHAGCYAMQLSFMLTGAGFAPTALDAKSTLEMDQVEGGFKIARINLSVVGTVPSISVEEFNELATQAKEICPVSQALSALPITLDAKLA